MNGQMPSDMLCKVKDCASKLCSMKVKDSLDLSMSITSKDKKDGLTSNCFYKKITSDTEFNLMKMLAAGAAVALTVSMMCVLCSNCKGKKR